jgi:hypothetical protein
MNAKHISIAKAVSIGAILGIQSTWADVRMVLPFYERYVAIDGACAWPQLNLLPNGQIAAILWPESNHALAEGAAECWVSQDAGISWQRAGIPVPNGPGTNRMNHASGVAPDGSLIAIVGGWDRVRAKVPFGTPIPPMPPGPLRGKGMDPVPAISRDGGRTWKQHPPVPPLPDSDGRVVAWGRIHALPDGKLGAMFYRAAVYFFTSSDGGASWQKRGQLIPAHKEELARTHNETDWIRLDNGDLFAAARTYGDRILEAYRSTDGGVTWKSEGALTMPSQHPASFVRLPDGQILLSYGTRNTGHRGVSFRVADPTARRWSDPIALVDFEDLPVKPGEKRPTDGGYPSTIVMPDGMLITAYYTASIPDHPRYHMGVVRWKLDPAVVAWPGNEGNFRKKP